MISYVDSEVAWLGEIPSHWPVMPSKRLFSNPRESSHPEDVQLTPSQKFGVLTQDDYMETSGSRVVISLSEVDTMKHVEPGDFISHLRSFQGGLEYSTLRGKISGAYTVLRPSRELHAEYFKYLFKSTMYVQALQTTTDQLRDGQSIKYAEFGLLPLPFPPIEEQRRISSFLDEELMKIDALVLKNTKLLALLTERRKTCIEMRIRGHIDGKSRAYKKPTSWLSDVPESWLRGPLKWYARFQTGATPEGAEFSESDGFPWLRPDDLDVSGNPSRASRFIDISGPKGLPQASAGSLLMCCIGATLGKVGLLDDTVTFNQQITSITSKRLDPRFLFYALTAAYEELQSISVGNTLNILNNARLGTVRVPVPTLEEQLRIVQILDEETSQIDALVARVEELQSSLGNRREVLISEAVLGHFLEGAA